MHQFPHFCQDGHERIGFNNGPAESVESCLVCLLREALQSIVDESQQHHEHDPTFGKNRLPKGYTTARVPIYSTRLPSCSQS